MNPVFDESLYSESSHSINYRQEYPVIIIGAGTAGLAAAYELTKANIEVLVLEARNRIGGRIHTEYSFGHPLELGASWLHGSIKNPIKHLFNSNQLIINSYSDEDCEGMLQDFALYNSDGQKVSDIELKEFKSLAKEFLKEMEAKCPHLDFETGFKDYAHKHRLTSKQKALLYYALENIYTYEYAENLHQLGFASERPYSNSTCSGYSALVVDGYNSILDKLSSDLSIALNQQVKRIDFSGNHIKVFTQNRHFKARKIIITVPLGVLKAQSIEFIPELPKEKKEAIDKLGMGLYEKLYLEFDSIFWDKDKEWIGRLTKPHEYAYNIFNFYKYTQKPILLFFASGKLAHNMKTQPFSSWAMKELKLLYGDKIPNPQKIQHTSWAQDPYAYGSYSYLPVQYSETLYHTMAESVQDKLYFAGEATSTTDPSTVHGAYLSGMRVAEEVLLS